MKYKVVSISQSDMSVVHNVEVDSKSTYRDLLALLF